MARAADHLPPDRAEYLADEDLYAAAAEGLDPVRADELRRRAKLRAEHYLTPAEAFYFAAWVVYYAEGGE